MYTRDVWYTRNENDIINIGLNGYSKRKLLNIIAQVPRSWISIANRSLLEEVVVFPFQTIILKNKLYVLKYLSSRMVYKMLIGEMVSMPKGLLKWCEELELSDSQIDCSLLFAKRVTKNIFRQVFQYKITTQILPTENYLFRYKVLNNDICEKCNIESGTIIHSLWECEKVFPLIDHFFTYIKDVCQLNVNIGMIDYIFGFARATKFSDGLNHCLLELKIFIFYNSKDWGEQNVQVILKRFIHMLARLMVKEKLLAIRNNKYELFVEKWDYFSAVYDFRGPDFEMIC